jgi:hypothetical protein
VKHWARPRRFCLLVEDPTASEIEIPTHAVSRETYERLTDGSADSWVSVQHESQPERRYCDRVMGTRSVFESDRTA